MQPDYMLYESNESVDPHNPKIYPPFKYPLSDRNLYKIVSSSFTGVARAKNWPKDFDRKGVPLLSRLGKGPPALVNTASGVRYPIICGGYQLHGQIGTDKHFNPVKNPNLSIGAKMMPESPGLILSNYITDGWRRTIISRCFKCTESKVCLITFKGKG